jgi:hypothetical protein
MTDYKLFRVPLERADGMWLVADLYCASFLFARGNSCVGIEPTAQRGRHVFVISPRDAFADDLAAWSANAAVPVRDFLDGVYFLKALVRESPASDNTKLVKSL